MLGGCGSSGTTLLRTLLDRHPDLACGEELSVLNKRSLYGLSGELLATAVSRGIAEGLPTQGALPWDYLPWSTSLYPKRELRFLQGMEGYHLDATTVVEIARASTSFPAFMHELLQPMLDAEGASRWAEKTPSNCYAIEPFLNAFPSGRYVHVIRDGRDVVISLVRRGWSIAAAVRRWIFDTSTVLRHVHDARVLPVRYEELVVRPEETLRQVLSFLDLDDDPTEVLLHSDRASHDQSIPFGHDVWTAHPGEAITSSAVGRWRRMPDEDRSLMVELFGRTWLSNAACDALRLDGQWNGLRLLEVLKYQEPDLERRPAMRSRRFLRHVRSEWGARLRRRPESSPYFRVSP